MRIAIQAADLDAPRIDGTRVYILNCLKYFGKLDSSSDFLIYHKKTFNPELTPPSFPNYKIIKKTLPYFWTQTRFAASLQKEKPDVLWMPMHNIPLMRRAGIRTVVTIHDLAFKYFPATFTKKDLLKINLLTRMAVTFADKIITISESSKKDILKFYPKVREDKIRVIYHGFDRELYEKERDFAREEETKKKYGISGKYLLYIGAIQPRKNLETLIESFQELRSWESAEISDLKLVLVGEKAWLSDGLFAKIDGSKYKNDIICPGKLMFDDMSHLLRGAEAFVFPSLYEGFGIPILEAMASKIPVICSDNSSLPEVGGDAAMYFDGNNASDLAEKIKLILTDVGLKKDLVARGLEQVKKFSWEKCARETLEYLKNS